MFLRRQGDPVTAQEPLKIAFGRQLRSVRDNENRPLKLGHLKKCFCGSNPRGGASFRALDLGNYLMVRCEHASWQLFSTVEARDVKKGLRCKDMSSGSVL